MSSLVLLSGSLLQQIILVHLLNSVRLSLGGLLDSGILAPRYLSVVLVLEGRGILL